MNSRDLNCSAISGHRVVRLPEVEAIRFIRKMRGRSETAMLQCNDGRYYIVKMMGNPQGTSVLGNEFLGTVLASAIGLPVPSHTSVFVSKHLIESTPAMWFESEVFTGKPKPGYQFGSLLVGGSFGPEWPTDRLSRSHFPLILNRRKFVDALVFDVWANHHDNRQAVFTEGKPTARHRTVIAHFIDHGHMFGGAGGIFDDLSMRGFYFDLAVYKGLDLSRLAQSAMDRIRIEIPRLLPLAINAVPVEWYSWDQQLLRDTLLARLDSLGDLVGPVLSKLVGI